MIHGSYIAVPIKIFSGNVIGEIIWGIFMIDIYIYIRPNYFI